GGHLDLVGVALQDRLESREVLALVVDQQDPRLGGATIHRTKAYHRPIRSRGSGRGRGWSLWSPLGVAREEAVREADLVDEEDPEREAEQARRVRERHGHRGRDEEHPRDGAGAERRQVDERPEGIADRAEDEERDGGRA